MSPLKVFWLFGIPVLLVISFFIFHSRWPRRRRIVLVLGVHAPLLLVPIFWRIEHIYLQLLQALLICTIIWKYLIYFYEIADFERPNFPAYLGYMTLYPTLFVERGNTLPPLRNALDFLLGFFKIGLGLLVIHINVTYRLRAYSFWLDDISQIFEFYCFASAYGHFLFPPLRALGFRLPPLNNGAFISKNLSEFWTKWNTPWTRFFHRYVFLASGGRRRYHRGVLLTFFVSGAVHEYLFDVTLGKIQGTMLLFFMVHALLILFLRRSGRWLRTRRGIRYERLKSRWYFPVLQRAFMWSILVLTSPLFITAFNDLFHPHGV